MKKKTFFLFCVFMIFISSCTQTNELNNNQQELTELQITACNSAHEANTCNTRLNELDIVTKEECCSILQKCC